MRSNIGIPLLIHQGTTFCSDVSLEIANPIQLQPIAIEFPRLVIVIAHLGHPWINETLVLIRKHRNLYADISALYYRPWQFYNALVAAMEYGVLHRLPARLRLSVHHAAADPGRPPRRQSHDGKHQPAAHSGRGH